jgi:hypothetical protein
MKPLSETIALKKLQSIRSEFTDRIRNDFEHRAKSCATCETPGACCLDEHFVNVRITRLEAVGIRDRLNAFSPQHREAVYCRVEDSIKKYKLDEGNSDTYACPLFEKGVGCLVHRDAKPLPCIAHACYDRKQDLPPDELLTEREIEIDRLNRAVYGSTTLLPLPVAIKRFS